MKIAGGPPFGREAVERWRCRPPHLRGGSGRPIEPTSDWATCLAFSRAVATAIARADPRRYTTSLPKSGRSAKILIDYLRNNRTNTWVAAFSTKISPLPPASRIWDHPRLHNFRPVQM
jgi:DNA primase